MGTIIYIILKPLRAGERLDYTYDLLAIFFISILLYVVSYARACISYTCTEVHLLKGQDTHMLKPLSRRGGREGPQWHLATWSGVCGAQQALKR